MKKCTLMLAMLLSLCANAQTRRNVAYQEYIERYKDLAIEQMQRYGIPASITLAQGLFESSAGRSRLARLGNNHFGIKCHGWRGRTISEDDDAQDECFRAYDTPVESFDDHSRFLKNNSRYGRLFQLRRDDYRGWAHGLKSCGYATNPQYASKLIGLIELYGLSQYDHAKKYDKFMVGRANDRPATVGGTLHPIEMRLDNYCLYAREGDTFRSIGEEVGISGKKIAKYNERGYNDRLQVGEVIFLKKKRKRVDKSQAQSHVVSAGESMYGIAQRYGIRLKSLYKMNKLPANYDIKVGDQLRLR